MQVTMYSGGASDHSNAPTPVNVLPLGPSSAASGVGSIRTTPLPARGRDPPPPPPGVPPLDLSQHVMWQSQASGVSVEDDDDSWRESLRRASAKQRARSMDMLEESNQQQQVIHAGPPPLIQPGPFSHQGSFHDQQHRQQQPPSQFVSHPMLSPIPGDNVGPTYDNMMMSPHINGYVWDERSQRFYRLNVDPTSPPNPRLFSSHQQPFLDQGLPNHTNSDPQDQQPQQDDDEDRHQQESRIRLLTSHRSKSAVGPELASRQEHSEFLDHSPPRKASMMGRPKSTLPYNSYYGQQNEDNSFSKRRYSLASSNTSSQSFSRTPRTSQSGLPDQPASPVPPSPAVTSTDQAIFFPNSHAPSSTAVALFDTEDRHETITTAPPFPLGNYVHKCHAVCM